MNWGTICDMSKIKINHSGGIGLVWIAGWLFTIGYLKLSFWWGALGFIVWPYFLGSHFA